MSIVITETFQDRMTELKDDCTSIGKGMRGTEQLRWMFSKEDNGTAKPGKFDFDGVHTLFDRSEAESNYAQALKNSPNSSKQELAVSTVQSDMLSGMERDFILRKRSRIRRLAHESVKRANTGSDFGVIELGTIFSLNEQVARMSEDNNGNQ